jgi:hypothetical protein
VILPINCWTPVGATLKRQTRLLVREGARTEQDRNWQTVNQHLVMSTRRGSTSRHIDCQS